jgi:hypothetical protein
MAAMLMEGVMLPHIQELPYEKQVIIHPAGI